MHVTASDKTFLPDLLRFLRSEGCIGYLEPRTDALMILIPGLFGQKEVDTLSALVARWTASHPGVEVEAIGD